MYVIPLYVISYIRKNGHDLSSHSKLKDKHYRGDCPTDSSGESTQEEGSAPGQPTAIGSWDPYRNDSR